MNIEQVVAKTHELADGQMKEVQVHDRKILLVRVDGQFKAYVPECPHHGAPMAEGLFREGHLWCPWHQSVFDARDGDLIEPPSLDRLPHYCVRVEGEDVIVVIPQEPLEVSRPPTMATFDPAADGRTFVILGAGAAGLAAAEMLRHEGFRGRILVLTGEQDVSYDRTELSKGYLTDPKRSRPVIRPGEFYDECDIEIRTGMEVREADTRSRTIACTDGTSMRYDKLLIATGGIPRRLGVDGEDLEGVFTLRSLADGERIRRTAAGASKAVVVGASFIGMEVASALRQRGLAVTVVAPESVPFERVFGREIGWMYRKVHEDKGTEFRLESGVAWFDGANGAVDGVVLRDGERLEADLVIVGVGVRPATDFLKGIDTNRDGSVRVDAHLRAAEDVFAAGDVARLPDWRTGEPMRIEHWRLAQQLGRTAARNMLEEDAPYQGVPFFWTIQHSVVLQYVGHAAGWDEVVLDGDPARHDFLAYYLRDGRVLAAAGCGKSREMAALAVRLQRPELPTVEEARRQWEAAPVPQRP